MASWRVAALIGFVLVVAGCTWPPPNPVPVAELDLTRYAGDWFELARIPNSFEDEMGKTCVDARANHALGDDGRLVIRNTCHNARADGAVVVSEGTARSDGPGGRLLATFLWPFSSPYWVLGVDPDYRWAVVGVPSRRYLWVLSRTPVLAAEDGDKVAAVVTGQGYDPKSLVWAKTP
jgi:apolipoprotein D and lipocalin family protein